MSDRRRQPGLSAKVQAVWEKGRRVLGRDPGLWRKDDFGNLIHKPAYGDRNSSHGWEIDHKRPVAWGGNDMLSNLRPLHWRDNVLRQISMTRLHPHRSGSWGDDSLWRSPHYL